MEVRLADHRGFCFGVRRAEALITEAVQSSGSLATLGPLVHNRHVVERLAKRGVRVVSEVAQVDEPVVAISAHGAPPAATTQAEARGIVVTDGTCPFVRKAQVAAKELVEQGFKVLVLGDATHREVLGIMGWAGEGAVVVSGSSDLPAKLPGKRIGIVCQTTQNPAKLQELLAVVSEHWLPQIFELRVINTICDASRKRQRAARELAAEVDVMIVIGDPESANTRRLAEVCAAGGAPTHRVEDVADLDPAWFEGKRVAGVTAGASTPDYVIDEITDYLRGI